MESLGWIFRREQRKKESDALMSSGFNARPRGSLLVCLLASGCGDSMEPFPAPDATILPCPLPCPAGFRCEDAICVPECSPACPRGLVCSPEGTCVPDETLTLPDNSCGGREVLDGTPGDPCGPCGSGRWLCAGANRAVCVDPTPRNACGGCARLPGVPGQACRERAVWQCAANMDLECVSVATLNVCGGLSTLTGLPGRRCGDCDSGFMRCDGRESIICEADPHPAACDCTRGPSALACGTDAGRCGRGIRTCNEDGRYSSCVRAALGEGCTNDSDCPLGFCVEEVIGFEESDDDACRPPAHTCTRRVCRDLIGTRGCTTELDCAPSQGCARGFCYDLVVRADIERCNGIDDDCNGKIDDDDRRTEICGLCPYNMVVGIHGAGAHTEDVFCLDQFEASRPDATLSAPGVNERYATSRADALPWTGLSAAAARIACSGEAENIEIPGAVPARRPCLESEWSKGCGPEGAPYPYGETYRSGVCHDDGVGISPTGRATECRYDMPPGFFGVFDMTGNVAEWVRGPNESYLAGGAFDRRSGNASCETRVSGSNAPGEQTGFRCCSAIVPVSFE